MKLWLSCSQIEDEEEADAVAVNAAAAAADVAQLQSMGFPRSKALEALEESGGYLEGAIEWLFAACA